jgi:hypothetical protein
MPKKEKILEEEIDDEMENDQEEKTDKEEDKKSYNLSDNISKEDEDKLRQQVQKEYKIAYHYIKPKIDEWAIRLRLYNNQKRDKEAVGDPTMFTTMQVLLATLYSDKLTCQFHPVEEGDAETASNLNDMLSFDSDRMELDQVKYDWIWDTCFFGRGLMLMMDFDRGLMCPIPEIINPMVFLRDPKATSVNGNAVGKGAARYCGFEVGMAKCDMERSGLYDMTRISQDNKGYNSQSLLDENAMARDDAQNRQYNRAVNELDDDNKEIRLLNWFTTFKGKKCFVSFTQDKQDIVRFFYISDTFKNKTPIIDRAIYPTPHDWDGVNAGDLTEDKQRGRAVLINGALKIAKREANQRFLFDGTKIVNRAALARQDTEYVEVIGQPAGSVAEMPTTGVKSSTDYVMNLLQTAAEKATAVTELKQGMGMGKTASATESDAAMASTEARYSLAAKIFTWSEKEFCRQYYLLYKEYFADEIDEKLIRINGPLGYQWRRLTKANLTSEFDPDVTVESTFVIENKNKKEYAAFVNFLNQAALMAPTNTNRMFALREFGKLSNVPLKTIDAVVMKTQDELIAQEENKMIEEHEIVEVHDFDNDYEHMLIHNKLPDDLPTKTAHIRAHIANLAIKAKKAKEAEAKAKEAGTEAPASGAGQPNAEAKNLQSMMTKTASNISEIK